MRQGLTTILWMLLATASPALALVVAPAVVDEPVAAARPDQPPIVTVQGNGVTLQQAIAQVKRSGNVERVLDAKTQVSGGREVHVIKVLTTDGKVRTHRVPGKKRN